MPNWYGAARIRRSLYQLINGFLIFPFDWIQFRWLGPFGCKQKQVEAAAAAAALDNKLNVWWAVWIMFECTLRLIAIMKWNNKNAHRQFHLTHFVTVSCASIEVIYWFFFMEPVDNSSAKVFYSISFGAQFAEFYDGRVHEVYSICGGSSTSSSSSDCGQ